MRRLVGIRARTKKRFPPIAALLISTYDRHPAFPDRQSPGTSGGGKYHFWNCGTIVNDYHRLGDHRCLFFPAGAMPIGKTDRFLIHGVYIPRGQLLLAIVDGMAWLKSSAS
jgi:hypothetical protein